MTDSFDLAQIVFQADSVWVVTSQPLVGSFKLTALGMFPTMRIAHHYMEWVREHNANEDMVAGCKLAVIHYGSANRKKR